MNSLLATPSPPHQLYNPRQSPSHPSLHFPGLADFIHADLAMTVSNPSGSNNRKRKAEDDEPYEDQLSASPASFPSLASLSLTAHRNTKRARSQPAGRPLTLPRLLETLDAESLRGVLQSICSRHPGIDSEVEGMAPRPTVPSALNRIQQYETVLRSAFPYGGDSTLDYTYNRVRQPLIDLVDAIAAFTSPFLPPHETQVSKTLSFLDGATDVIHRLPNWNSFQSNLHKQNAYEEISAAWVLAIQEMAKKAGGLQLDGTWTEKISNHNQQANGKLQGAMNELRGILGWMGVQALQQQQHHQNSNEGDDLRSVRQEMMSGTYASSIPVGVEQW